LIKTDTLAGSFTTLVLMAPTTWFPQRIDGRRTWLIRPGFLVDDSRRQLDRMGARAVSNRARRHGERFGHAARHLYHGQQAQQTFS